MREARTWRFALLGIGFGCLIAYARMASFGFAGYLSYAMSPSVDAWYGLRAATCSGLLVVLALSGWFKWFKVGSKTLVVCTAVAAAAAILFAADVGESYGAAVAVLGGAASPVLMYVWMMLLSSYDAKSIAGASVVGLAVAVTAGFGVPLLGPSLGLAVVVGAAVASGASALVIDPGLSSCAPDGKLEKNDVRLVPWPLVVLVLACGFFSTVLYGIAVHLTWLYDWAPNGFAFAVSTAIVMAATLTILVSRRDWMQLAWVPLLALFALALAFSCFSLRESIQMAVGFMLATVFCSHFLHWVLFPAVFSQTGVPRAFLTGVFLLIANGSLATMAGDAIGGALPHSMQNLGGVAGIMVLALVALAAGLYVVYRRALGTTALFAWQVQRDFEGAHAPGGDALSPESHEVTAQQVSDAPSQASPIAAEPINGGEELAAAAEAAALADADEQDVADLLKARMSRYAEEYGLTPRESEVALLTVQGFSCSYIAEKLVVSNSTVRFHQQNLYRKFDVHSRNELIELATVSE